MLNRSPSEPHEGDGNMTDIVDLAEWRAARNGRANRAAADTACAVPAALQDNLSRSSQQPAQPVPLI